MGVLESRCPTCGRSLTIVYHDRTRETLVVDQVCRCPLLSMPRIVTDGVPPAL
ncbi:MAG TPA: hypothetical protein VK723_01420 [Thermoplasmata archaeon]|nr:hypothetical protein [Thermoplasmata archaeon]